jgi:hypothetical protein
LFYFYYSKKYILIYKNDKKANREERGKKNRGVIKIEKMQMTGAM